MKKSNAIQAGAQAKRLWAFAKKMQKKAYAPYSKFRVGAALVDSSGRVFTGCNVENASYGATTCAERNAVAAMIARGGKEIMEIVVVTDNAQGCPPCGICRQVLREFVNDKSGLIVHIASPAQILASMKLSELYPQDFSKKELRK